MRRLHLVFAIVVVTAFLSAFLAERRRPAAPPGDELYAPAGAPLEPLRLARGEHAVRGVVTDHLGRPEKGVSVQLTALAPLPTLEPLFFDSTDATGGFELSGVPAGSFELLLLAPGVPTATREIAVPLAEDLRLALGVPYPELKPAPDLARTTVEGLISAPPELGPPRDLGGYEVLLRPRDDEARWHGAVERRTETAAGGRFRFEGLAVADYDLSVLPGWAAGGSWPALATLALDAAALLRAQEEPESRALSLELSVGELEGRLVDPSGEAIEGALLRLRAVGDPPERAWPAATTDADGRFLLFDLPAGPTGKLYNVSVHAGAARRETEIEVRPGLRRTVALGELDTRPEGD